MKNIHHIALSVKKIEESSNFYLDLGFLPYKNFRKEELKADAAMLKLGETILELFCFDEQRPKPDGVDELSHLGMKHFAVKTEDIEKTYKELREKGIKFRSEPKRGSSGFMYCFFEDNDGNLIELMQ